MFPVYLFNENNNANGLIGVDVKTFEKNFLTICKDHLTRKQARAFAFFLCDLKNYNFIKLINDATFWNYLHSQSGNYLTIFYLNAPARTINELFRRGETEYVNKQLENFEQYLFEKFSIDNPEEIKLPAILFFQILEDETIPYTWVSIEDKYFYGQAEEVRKFIDAIVEALANIDEDNITNKNEIFIQVSDTIEHLKTFRQIKKGVKYIKDIKDLIPGL